MIQTKPVIAYQLTYHKIEFITKTTLIANSIAIYCLTKKEKLGFSPIGRVNNIPTRQFFTGVTRNTPSKSYMLSLAECVWDFQNSELWNTHQHVLTTGVHAGNDSDKST